MSLAGLSPDFAGTTVPRLLSIAIVDDDLAWMLKKPFGADEPIARIEATTTP